MPILDRSLIKAINSGICLAIVGSGPSIEIGLPTWKKLAEDALSLLDKKTIDAKKVKLKKLFDREDYPQIFSVICEEIGIEKLTSWVGKALESDRQNGRVYKFLSSWPFSNYLTTNFDNILLGGLQKIGVPAVAKLNTRDDMLLLRSDCKNVVFKIHGDCTNAKNIVLTSEQYSEFRKAPSKKYWRDKLSSAPTPTENELDLRMADFSCLADALDYAAQGETGCNFYRG
ncbi:MAG: SIR2 family protein, partial [Anaerolineales bacterium]|nr:SIR2 family protein [Anaerolineales bacterium]